MTVSVGASLRLSPFIVQFLIVGAASAQNSLTFEQAIATARANRPAFQAARLRVNEAMHARSALGAYPASRLFVGYTSDSEVGGMDDDLVLAVPIDIFGRTAAGRNSGNALVARAEAEFRSVAADVQNEVVTAYLDASASLALASSAKSVQEALQNLYEVTRLRIEGGAVAGIQLTRVGLELDQAKLRTEQRQTELTANIRRLEAVLGPDAKASLAGAFPAIPVVAVDAKSIVAQRADLLILAAEVRAAEADARSARLGGLPDLEVQGRRTPWQETDRRYGLRVQLSIPLGDFGRVRSESRAASTRAEAARKALADATNLALGEISAAQIEVDAARNQLGRYEALVATARQIVERLWPALTEQATTLIEVIDATRTLREVEEGLIEARQRLAEAQARHLKATGQILEVSK